MIALNRCDIAYWNHVAVLIRQGVETFPPFGQSFCRLPLSPYIGFDLLGSIQGASVVELGCGHGHILENLLPIASRIIGIDFSPMQLQLAKEKLNNANNVELLEHDLNNGLPKELSNIDCYYSIYGAFDFVNKPDQLLNECWMSIPVGGHIAILSSFLPLAIMSSKLYQCNVEISVALAEKHHAIRIRKTNYNL